MELFEDRFTDFGACIAEFGDFSGKPFYFVFFEVFENLCRRLGSQRHHDDRRLLRTGKIVDIDLEPGWFS
jgi:hypothetical protein